MNNVRNGILVEIVQYCSIALDEAVAISKALECENAFCAVTKISALTLGMDKAGVIIGPGDTSRMYGSIFSTGKGSKRWVTATRDTLSLQQNYLR